MANVSFVLKEIKLGRLKEETIVSLMGSCWYLNIGSYICKILDYGHDLQVVLAGNRRVIYV